MSAYLLDTNCISELVRAEPDPGVMTWLEAADEALLYLSVLTMGEIRKGIAGLSQGKRRTRLETWLEVGTASPFRQPDTVGGCGRGGPVGVACSGRQE